MLRLIGGFGVDGPFVDCSRWDLRYFEEIWVTKPITFYPLYEVERKQ
jgi:hypothetical protein